MTASIIAAFDISVALNEDGSPLWPTVEYTDGATKYVVK
jgi:hypothetical protein